LALLLGLELCGSRNYPYYPHGRSLEIPRGRGVLKDKLLEGQYEAKQEFPGGCGVAKQKTFRGGSMDIFWNYTLQLKSSILYCYDLMKYCYLTFFHNEKNFQKLKLAKNRVMKGVTLSFTGKNLKDSM